MFSLESKLIFDPFELDEEATPKATRQYLRQSVYDIALSMALRLNEPDLIREVLEQIPMKEVTLLYLYYDMIRLAKLPQLRLRGKMTHFPRDPARASKYRYRKPVF